MSTFSCPVTRVEVIPHPNADTLDLAQVGLYQAIIKKGSFVSGDYVVYIPEAAVVPDEILHELGLYGALAGSSKNRVKAIKLRGILSQGLCYPVKMEGDTLRVKDFSVHIGEDVSTILGITKYEPPIPTQLGGEVFCETRLAFKYDVEDLKKYPKAFNDGEHVTITEKVHGSCGFYAVVLDEELTNTEMFDGKFLVGSKGLMAKGLYFKNTVDNSYTRQLEESGIKGLLTKMAEQVKSIDMKMLFCIGEVLGVQGGFNYGGAKFRGFAVGFITKDERKVYLPFKLVLQAFEENGLEAVPVLYEGPFDLKVVKELAEGKEQVSGEEKHIREGVVVYPMFEIDTIEYGRKVLKYVGETYLSKSTGEEIG